MSVRGGDEGDVDDSDSRPQGLRGTVIRGVGLAGAGHLLGQALNLGFYVALARVAAPSDFGEFAAGSILVAVGLLLSQSGIGSALIQRRDRLEEAAATAVVATFASGLSFGVLALGMAPLIGLFFASSRIGEIAAVMSGVIFVRTLSAVPDALLQRRFSFLRRLVVEPVSVIAFGTVAVTATSKGLGPWGLVAGQYAAALVDLSLSWTLARYRPKLQLASFAMWRELVSYGRHIVTATVVLRAGDQGDTLWLGRFLGTGPLGQYRFGFRLASAPYAALLAAAGYVLFPAFARIAGERERFEAAFMRALRWMAFVGFFTGFLVLGLGEPLAVILFGDVWREAGYAAMAMAMYTAAGTITSISSEALKAHGRPDLLIRMHGLMTMSALVLMGAMLPLGVVGVAGALSIAASISAGYSIWLMTRTIGFPLRDMAAEIARPTAAGLLMASILIPLEQVIVRAAHQPFIEAVALTAAEGLLGAAIFVTAMALVAPTVTSELWDTIPRRRNRGRRPILDDS